MGQTVELEVAGTANNPGDSVAVGASGVVIAEPFKRKALVLANPSATVIVWVKFTDDTGAAVVGEGIAVFPGSGLAIKEYGGPVIGIAESEVALGRVEF